MKHDHTRHEVRAVKAVLGARAMRDGWTPVRFSETPCPRCLALAQDGRIRPETVQRMPEGVGVAPIAQDGSGKCCFDCGTADGLMRRVQMTFEMARIAVGNERQEQYRLPGAPIGATRLRLSAPGDLEKQHEWLDRMNWFDVLEGRE